MQTLIKIIMIPVELLKIYFVALVSVFLVTILSIFLLDVEVAMDKTTDIIDSFIDKFF